MRIRHKGLRALHERDNPVRVPPVGLVPRLKRILFRLQEATHPRSAGFPAASPEVRPRGPVEHSRLRNWHVVFRFEDGMDVDLIDYH